MLGALTPEQKDWKSYVPALVHAYNCTRNAPTGFSPYYLLFGREPMLPVDGEFGLQKGGQKGSPGESNYVSQLRRRLTFAHRKAKHMAQKQQAKHRELYDLKCMGAALDVGDLALVQQTAWKGRHKIQDRWESGEYQVVGQPTPDVPVYTVKGVAVGKTRVFHRNLLLPLQGRVRQPGGKEGEGISGSDEEEEGRGVMPKVARAPRERPRSTTKPKSSPTQQKEASVVADAFADPKAFSRTIPSSPESLSGDGDSDGEETYTDSLTSHKTVSNYTSADLLTSTASAVEASSSIPPSVSDSQFSTVMPYLKKNIPV